jgi:hypothetical protein
LYSSYMMPVFVFGLALLDAWRTATTPDHAA